MTRDDTKQLSFTKTETVCLVAVASLMITLFLPAAKQGEVLTGLDLFAIGALMSFLSTGELAFKSGVAVVLNASCLAAVVAVFNGMRSRLVRVAIASIAAVCFVILLVPYSSLERVFAGYYLWLVSALAICLTPLLPCNVRPMA